MNILRKKRIDYFVASAFIITVVLLGIFTLYRGISHAGVAGSKHDLSMGGNTMFQYGTSQVCVFCHTPHDANAAVSGYLWNRTLETTTFNVYTSSTLNAAPSTSPGVQTLLCMSCHDGVGAFNIMLNYPSDWDPGVDPGFYKFSDFALSDPNIGPLNIGENGGNLSNDHPVSFTYDATLATADGKLTTPVDLTKVDAAGKLRLFNNSRFECSTCHNPHNNDVCGVPDACNFLVMGNSGSALCLSCHNK